MRVALVDGGAGVMLVLREGDGLTLLLGVCELDTELDADVDGDAADDDDTDALALGEAEREGDGVADGDAGATKMSETSSRTGPTPLLAGFSDWNLTTTNVAFAMKVRLRRA